MPRLGTKRERIERVDERKNDELKREREKEGGEAKGKERERRVLAARREAHTSLAGYSHFRSYT